MANIKVSSRRQFRVSVELEDGPAEFLVTFRPATAQERASFRCTVAGNKALQAAANPQDVDALRSLMSGDVAEVIGRQSIACCIDIADTNGAPVLFDDKAWRDLDDGAKADVAAAFPALFQLVFAKANPNPDARLLGK